QTPAFVKGGVLHATSGYCPAGRSYYAPTDRFCLPPLPARPSQTDINAARSLICDELLVDFPFADGEAERSNTVALYLLPFVRSMILGPTPLHLIEKPTPGTGASLLVEIMARIVTGRPTEPITEGRDEDEWRKRLTARLRSSPPFIFIDNVRRRLDSAQLAAALTTTVWRDRVLGSSEEVGIPNRSVWVATGNNPSLSNELARRTVRIRLDAKRDRPWLRSGFKHEAIRQWVGENRSSLVHAALVLVHAWISEGQPRNPKGVTLGMFEEWSVTMGGIL